MAFHITASKDRLICYVGWVGPISDEYLPQIENLSQAIEQKKVVGVEPSTIDKAYNKFMDERELRLFELVHGTPPTPPTDGKLELLFDPTAEKETAGKLDESGRMDFRERREFVAVNKGDTVGTWTPPAEGKPGVDVFGEAIPPPKPKEHQVKAGKNVTLSDDGIKYIAEINGHILISGNVLSIVEIHTVRGDVDFTTGNIRFPGSVEVGGNVKEGFTVEAKGNLLINGLVDNAEVRAGGSIVVKKGIINNSRVIADGDLEVEFIQESTVKCEGKLTVQKAIVNSEVDVTGDIEILSRSKPHGIVGGSVTSTENISAYCIGSEIGTKTQVNAGRNNKLFFNRQKLNADVWQAEDNIKRFEYVLRRMSKIQAHEWTKEDEKKRGRIEKVVKIQQSEMEIVQKELDQVNTEIMKYLKAKILVHEIAFDGTEIGVGDRRVTLENSVKRAVFKLDSEGEKIINEPIELYKKE